MINIINRRDLLRGAGGLTIAAMPIPSFAQGATPPKPEQIVVNGSGGAMTSIMRRTYFAEFEKRYGIRVVDTSPADFGKLRAMVQSGNPEWTVTEISGQDGPRAKELNLLEPLDPSILVDAGYPESARDSHLLLSSAYSTVLGYRTDTFPNNNHPKGWAEFWDVKRFPGARSLRNHPVDNLEFALLADGVPADQLYPLDLDRAFRKLDEIKPHIAVWWTTGAQPTQLLIDKEVVLSTGWNGRFYEIARRNGPIAIEFAGGSLKTGTFGIPRGTKNAYWGQQLLRIMAEPQLQAVTATELSYAGMNPKSLDFVPKDVLPFLPNTPDNLKRQFWLNVDWWTENSAKAQERWSRWMLRRT